MKEWERPVEKKIRVCVVRVGKREVDFLSLSLFLPIIIAFRSTKNNIICRILRHQMDIHT